MAATPTYVKDLPAATTSADAGIVINQNGTKLLPVAKLRAEISAETQQAVQQATEALDFATHQAVAAALAEEAAAREAAIEAKLGPIQLALAALQAAGGATPTASILGSAATRGVAGSFTVAFSAISTVWTCLEQAGTLEGVRVQRVAPGVYTMTPQAAGIYRAAVYTAETGGEKLDETDPFTVAEPAAAAALPAITYTPSSPSFPSGTAPGTPVIYLSAVPAGATRSLTGDGRLVFNAEKTQLVVGATAHSAGTEIPWGVSDADDTTSNKLVTISGNVAVTAAESGVALLSPSLLAGVSRSRAAYTGNLYTPTDVASGGRVTGLFNQVGGGMNFMQETESLAPQLFKATSLFGGKDALNFPGTSSASLSTGDDVILMPSAETGHTIAFLARVNQPVGAHGHIFNWTDAVDQSAYAGVSTPRSWGIATHWDNQSTQGAGRGIYVSSPPPVGSTVVSSLGGVNYSFDTLMCIALEIKPPVGDALPKAQLRVTTASGSAVGAEFNWPFPFNRAGRITIGKAFNRTDPGNMASIFRGMTSKIFHAPGLKGLAATDYLLKEIGIQSNLSGLNPPAGGSTGGGTGGSTGGEPPVYEPVEGEGWASASALIIGGSTPTLPSRKFDGGADGLAADTVVFWGGSYRRNDFPAGSALKAIFPGNVERKVRTRVMNKHAGNSARWVLHSVRIPSALAANATTVAQLAIDNSPDTYTDLSMSALPAISLVVTPTSGGTAWTLDLKAAAVASTDVWMSNDQVRSVRVTRDVPSTAVGSNMMRLLADVDLYADGTTWVETKFSNDKMGGTVVLAAYTATLTINGVQALNLSVPKHYNYQAWSRQRGVKGTTLLLSKPLRRPEYDIDYIADTSMIPLRPETDITLAQSVWDGIASRVNHADWPKAFGERGLKYFMPGTGGAENVGPWTHGVACWLTSGDRRAEEYALGQAENSMNVGNKFWDASRNSWVDARVPEFASKGIDDLLPKRPDASLIGWTWDVSHEQDPAYIQALLTGRRSFYDEQMAWAAGGVLFVVPGRRAGGLIICDGRYDANQARGIAWGMREIDGAALLSIDGSPEQAQHRAVSDANWKWLRDQIPGWKTLQGEAYGRIEASYDRGDVLEKFAPWQQSFCAYQYIRAARLGHPEAKEFLDTFAFNWWRGALNSAFNPRDIAAYNVVQKTAAGGQRLTTWQSLKDRTVATGYSNGTGWTKDDWDYGQYAVAALSSLVDYGAPNARALYDAFIGIPPKNISKALLSTNPHVNAIPRGVLRPATSANN